MTETADQGTYTEGTEMDFAKIFLSEFTVM